MLGGPALGVYSMAGSLGRLPVEKVAALLSQVSPAFLALNQHDRPALRGLIVTLTQALSFTVLPICGGMLLVAPDGVALALGSQWLDVTRPLQVFAIVAAFDSIGSVLSPVLVVAGRARLLMYIGLSAAVAMPAAFYLGTRWGLVGVAAAYAIVSPVMRVPAYLAVSRVTGLSFAEYRGALEPAMRATSAMMLVVLGVRVIILPDWPLVLRLVVEVLSGAITYLLILATIYRPRVVELYRVFRAGRGGTRIN